MLRTRLWMGAILILLTVGMLTLDQRFSPWYPFLFVFFAALAGLTGVAGFVFFAALAGLVGFVVDIGFVAEVSLAVLAKGLQELKVLDSFEDVALRPVVAVDGKLDLAAQDRLEGRHRDHATVFLYGDGAISLRQQQRVRALHRLAPRPVRMASCRSLSSSTTISFR